MLIEIAGWAAPQGGVITSYMAGPRAFLLLVFLLVGALLVLYGKTIFYSGSWKATVSSAPMVAWLLTKVESEPVKALEKVTVEKLAKDHRLKLDSAAARRLSRSVFLRDHKEFDCNVPPKDREMGLKVTETYELNSRGMDIFVKSWVPIEKKAKGVIFLCHGYGDTVTFFFEGLARVFAVAGYAVYGMDYPGFGMSEGLHGYVPDFDRLVDDVMEQYRAVKGFALLPFGESMGGAVALKAHLKEPSMWDGAVLVAPMCKIADAMYPPWYLVQIMLALAHVVPKAKLVPHTDIAAIGFRDLEKRKRASYNPVAYVGNPRLGTALSLLQTTDYIESKLHEVSLPLLVLHGAADLVTDSSISKVLHEKAKSADKTLRLYDNAWHCILEGEPDDVVKNVIKDIITWLDVHSGMKCDSDEATQCQEQRLNQAAPNLIDFGKSDPVQLL